jgi:hypothetical protein
MTIEAEEDRIEPQTLSHALLKLGKIRSIEDPIMFGLLGFYRAQQYSQLSHEEKEEMEQHLKLFQEFCLHFDKIASSINGKKNFDQWLAGRGQLERMSRVGTYSGIQLVFAPEDIKEKAIDFKLVCKTTHEVLKGKIDQKEVSSALTILEQVQQLVSEKLEPQRRSSEKIISNNIPPMNYAKF